MSDTMPRRHPAEVTSDRLADARSRWHKKLSGEELDMLSRLRLALQAIADGERRFIATDQGREHIPSADCWCDPEVEHVPPRRSTNTEASEQTGT